MKQIIGIFSALVLVPSMQVQAWVGGPWGNDAYDQNGDDGVYEAVGTMIDGTAMYRWAVQNNNPGGVTIQRGGSANGGLTGNTQFGGQVGSSSSHIIWFRGIVYMGQCFGIVNSHMNTVMVTGNASDDGLDGGNNPINGIRLRPGATSSLNISNGAGVAAAIPQRKTTANSTWRGKMNKSHPSKRFHGNGYVSFLGESTVDIVIVQLGLGILTGAQVLGPISVTAGSASNDFPFQGFKVRMRVFGTRVSTAVTG